MPHTILLHDASQKPLGRLRTQTSCLTPYIEWGWMEWALVLYPYCRLFCALLRLPTDPKSIHKPEFFEKYLSFVEGALSKVSRKFTKTRVFPEKPEFFPKCTKKEPEIALSRMRAVLWWGVQKLNACQFIKTIIKSAHTNWGMDIILIRGVNTIRTSRYGQGIHYQVGTAKNICYNFKTATIFTNSYRIFILV